MTASWTIGCEPTRHRRRTSSRARVHYQRQNPNFHTTRRMSVRRSPSHKAALPPSMGSWQLLPHCRRSCTPCSNSSRLQWRPRLQRRWSHSRDPAARLYSRIPARSATPSYSTRPRRGSRKWHGRRAETSTYFRLPSPRPAPIATMTTVSRRSFAFQEQMTGQRKPLRVAQAIK